jgi:hypothetical protein
MATSVPVLEPVELPTGSNGINAIGRCKDNGGNSFIARLIQSGNDTWIECYKRTSAGVLSYVGDFTMGPDPGGHARKMVDVHAMLDGDNVVCTVTGYDLTSPKRKHYQEEYVFAHVAVPYPSGVSPESGAGPAMWRAEGSGGGDVEVDYERIKADTAAVVEQWARTTIANIIPKTKIGVEQLFDGGNGSAVVYQQLINTSYTGALGAIRDSDKVEDSNA